MQHEIKCAPRMFERLLDGTKTFEVRKDDRGYQTGDELIVHEYDPTQCRLRCGKLNCTQAASGRTLEFRVGFIFRQGFGCDLGEYVVLSLLPAGVTT